MNGSPSIGGVENSSRGAVAASSQARFRGCPLRIVYAIASPPLILTGRLLRPSVPDPAWAGGHWHSELARVGPQLDASSHWLNASQNTHRGEAFKSAQSLSRCWAVGNRIPCSHALNVETETPKSLARTLRSASSLTRHSRRLRENTRCTSEDTSSTTLHRRKRLPLGIRPPLGFAPASAQLHHYPQHQIRPPFAAAAFYSPETHYGAEERCVNPHPTNDFPPYVEPLEKQRPPHDTGEDQLEPVRKGFWR